MLDERNVLVYFIAYFPCDIRAEYLLLMLREE